MRDATADKIAGLEKGAEDYFTKPFEMNVLSVRLRALEGRLSMEKHSEIVNSPVVLDTAAHQLHVNRREVELSQREYMLRRSLIKHPGRVLYHRLTLMLECFHDHCPPWRMTVSIGSAP